MRTRNRVTLIGSAAAMLLLILDGKTAVRGIYEGIQLCLNSLLPALFPFSVLSILITGSIIGKKIPILAPVCRFCRIPAGCESLFAVGILGGYPVGAQNVMIAFRDGKIPEADARRMAVFCNNAGPSFIFGILGPLFPSPVYLWLLWGIQILSGLITGRLMPGGSRNPQMMQDARVPSATEAIQIAAKGMVHICSCVVLFRMVLEFLLHWILWYFPSVIQVMISGLLELSNGCLMLYSVESAKLRFILAAVLLSFGGLCVRMQTVSVCDGLDLKSYLPWKGAQSVIAGFLAAAAVTLPQSAISLAVVIPAAAVIRRMGETRKKEVAF